MELLKKQLTSPVLWEPSMQKMISVAVAMWILGPGVQRFVANLDRLWLSCGFPKFPKHPVPSPTGTKSEMIFLGGLIKMMIAGFNY